MLDADTVRGLAELLRFRHVVRHLYAYELDPPQVWRLLEAVPGLWAALTVDPRANASHSVTS